MNKKVNSFQSEDSDFHRPRISMTHRKPLQPVTDGRMRLDMVEQATLLARNSVCGEAQGGMYPIANTNGVYVVGKY